MQKIRFASCVFTVVVLSVQPLGAQAIPNFTPPTPLFRAMLGGNIEEVKQLLNEGANPNEGRFINAPPLVMSLMLQDPALARVLIEKGADIKATDGTGATTLMWASAFEAPDTAMVQQLLRAGVDPNAANKTGETALTWALRRGYTPVVELLKRHGASDQKMILDSVTRAVNLLQTSAPEFLKVSGCTSCHHQSLPQMAVARAQQRGVNIDPATWDKQSKAVVAMFKPYREQMMQGKTSFPNPAISVSYSLIGLGAAGYPADEVTEAMAHVVSIQQKPDGGFHVLGARPPLESSAVSAAALSIKALQFYGKDPEQTIVKAREWLSKAVPRTTEESAMRLLGLAWAKGTFKDNSEIQRAAQALIAEQRPDGGWGQLPGLESDSYATGQALVALHEAGQITTADAIYGRGAGFLLRTQQPDGSWLVRTRSFPVQKLKESGFPHGKNQWISASGTSWAVMALTLGLPAEAVDTSEGN